MMNSQKILFVEDDDDDVFLLKRVCKKMEIERFEFAANGRKAVELLKPLIENPAASPEPPIIFLDLNMPEMNGFDFLRWVRSESRLHSSPVIILSTSENPRDIQSAYTLGANAYLVKTSDMNELGNMISAANKFWRQYNRVPA
jgi:CheY-like chemotaxis protein